MVWFSFVEVNQAQDENFKFQLKKRGVSDKAVKVSLQLMQSSRLQEKEKEKQMPRSQPEEKSERPAKKCAGNCFLDLKFVHEKPNHFIAELQRFSLFFAVVQSPIEDITPDKKEARTKLVLKPQVQTQEVSVDVHWVDEPSKYFS